MRRGPENKYIRWLIMSGISVRIYAILISGLFILSFSPAISPEPGTYLFYKLNFIVKDPVARPDLEAEMLRMVNEERRKSGLNPLIMDPDLVEVARRHSRDMFARGYFSHYSPEKISPFDRIKEANLNYSKAGENLSMAPTLILSLRGLMQSAGHRENILRPNFGRLGIGIMDGGQHGLMITQDFRN